ncbi:MAG: hypothetical protein PHG44_09780, partial [Lentisphaeria bacterium]|nr:hypothetical protein [Lentisphaeria bacterium]
RECKSTPGIPQALQMIFPEIKLLITNNLIFQLGLATTGENFFLIFFSAKDGLGGLLSCDWF